MYFFLFNFLGIEDLCTKRDELQKQILNEEEEKSKIQNDIRILSERLAKINESLAKKIASRNEYDKTIAETEAAYMKVCFDKMRYLNQRKLNIRTPPIESVWFWMLTTTSPHKLLFGSTHFESLPAPHPQ